MAIDLHIHSNYSDGTYSPEEIVKKAHARSLTAVSITDHDTALATPEALLAGEKYGVEVIPGIELSAVLGDINIHILGYYFNHKSKILVDKLNVLQEERAGRNKKIIQRLQQCGIDITLREVINVSGGGQIGRPHIGRVLVKKKVVKDLNEAFQQYLKSDAKAYVSRFVYTAAEVIDMLRSAGGIAVLAHPYQPELLEKDLGQVIEELVGFGLGGLEVYYPTHSRKMIKQLNRFRERYDLVATGGSDYHGSIRPGTDIAGGSHLLVPAEVLDRLRCEGNKLRVI